MSEVKVDKISPKTGTSMTVGDSGDTFTVPSGATLTVAGALNVTGTTSLADGTVAVAELDIDGASDIGAGIADADLFVVDDNAAGANRKTAASRLKTYILADNSIDSDMYVDGSIDTAHIANDQITAALIADNAIDSDMYVDGSIDTAHIAANQVTGAKLNTDVISAQTALTAEPADTDEFMISDAGVLKRIDYSLIKGGGKVNQYVFAMENNPQTINSTGSFATLTNVAATITPSATDSKILIFVNTNAYVDFGQGWYVNINRAISGGATTQIYAESDKSTYIVDGNASSAKLFATSPITTQDTSHSTTSACTYQVGIRTTGEIYMNNNRQSSITVVEVLA